jgi:tetratricopeptide (TPR) repeat protein
VDLSVALDDMNRAAGTATPDPQPAGATEATLSAPAAIAPAEEQYELGRKLHEAGRHDEAIGLLQAAAVALKLRFASASMLGRIHRDRGDLAEAIEWFERAAQAPAPTADEGHRLLFDLAEALERAGETSRALAICLELQADAGNYRDVAARIDRLARVRTRG